jgi:hypothetical protein
MWIRALNQVPLMVSVQMHAFNLINLVDYKKFMLSKKNLTKV